MGYRWIENLILNNIKKNKININKNNLLSFLTHAAGILVLYCKEVEEKYLKLKNQYLYENDTNNENTGQSNKINPKRKKTLDDPTFDLSKIEQENFVIEFLSYLRLHNKAEKRHLYKGGPCLNTKWKIFNTKKLDWIELNNEKHQPKTRNEYDQVKILLENRINIKKNNS